MQKEILTQIRLQLSNFFSSVDFQYIENQLEKAYVRCMNSIAASNDKYMKNNDGSPRFLIYHSGCWALFLYYLSNCIGKCPGGGISAEQVYYLNKILHCVDWFYQIDLPEHFMVEHPIGSVLGRASYGDYLYIYQGVTIGGNIESKTGRTVYPVLGNNVLMYAGSRIIGNSHIGSNVILGANTYVINEDIPDNSIVFGSSPDLVIRNDPEAVYISTKRNWMAEVMEGV